MLEQACPQCKRPLNEAANRLVKDSCGHQKCRVCLVQDEEQCKQCQISEEDNEKASVIKFENNHTVPVITRNGTAKPEVFPEPQPSDIKEEEVAQLPAEPSKDSKVKKAEKRSYQNIALPNHITITEDPVKYKCNICDKQFGTRSHIKYHVYCTGQTKPFRCALCPRDFITKSQLDLHMLKHTGAKPFVCNVCQKSFSEKSKLNRHAIVHSPAKSFVCSECGKALRSYDSLKVHMLIHRGAKPYTCKVCSTSFNNSSNLKKHLVSHSKEKVHMCDQCGKRFKLKWALTVHRRSHSSLRPFKCSTCSRAFVNNKDLQRHQLIHLGTVEQYVTTFLSEFRRFFAETKAFNCSICMTSFRRKDNLYRHVKNTHPGKKAEAVTSTVKQLIKKPQKPVVDNPNAINVITASPSCKAKTETAPVKPDNRTGTVINGPLKLAFKTNAFKSSYNIRRDCEFDLMPKVSKSYDMAESVNICQKILSPHSPPTARGIIKKASDLGPTSTEICQKILSPFPTRPLHYETSFEHKKHAIIKNIKFKLPANYTNLKVNDTLKDVIPLTPVSNMNLNLENSLVNSSKSYTELKTVQPNAASVIVNSPSASSMHWRRRTSQNLSSKILEN